MRLVQLIVVAFGTLPLATSAYQITDRLRQQQSPVLHSEIPSPAHSFDRASSIESGSSRKSRFSLDRFKLKPSTTFRCHSYPQDHNLSDLAADITDLLNRYRDQLFTGKGNPGRIPVNTCHAGYAPENVSPSVYLTSMTRPQAEVVRRLLTSSIEKKFPSVKMVETREGIALVQEKGKRGLRRRATI
ncbi:MAG: hypothetical protein Q9166_008044 [cf. Caloplaca sp. 2 TL-2023]